jgi:hypothetical protein
MYEPSLLHVTGTTTCADLRNQIWQQLSRFMEPAFMAGHTAEHPPYSVHILAPLRFVEESAVSRAKGYGDGVLEAAARAHYEPLAHSDALFRYDHNTASILLQAIRPNQAAMAVFPMYVNPQYGNQVAWGAQATHPAQRNPVPDVDLASLLELNQQSELLTGMEEVYCRTCKTHRAFTKAMKLWRLPPIIPVTLKRFKAVENNWGSLELRKSEDPVTYPVLGLDMSPYLIGPREQQVPALAFAPGRDACPTLPPIYDLFAVSNHHGGMGGGHYTAHIQDFATGQWHHMDGAFLKGEQRKRGATRGTPH